MSRAPRPAEVERAVAALKADRRRTKPMSVIVNELIIQELRDFLVECYPAGGGKVLDLGAGTAPYAPLYELFFAEAVRTDHAASPHDLQAGTVFADAAALPFPDDEFDCVLSTEVLEHVPYPHQVFKEIARVLKPGGAALVTTPFVHWLHELPYDFFRYAPPALELMARDAGLTVETIKPKGNRGAVALLAVQQPLMRLSRKLRLPVGARRVLIGGPQAAYLAAWSRSRRRGGTMPLGHMTRLRA